MEVNLKGAEWKVNTVKVENSRIEITENLSIMTEKKYNWLQRKMWKILLNIDIKEV